VVKIPVRKVKQEVNGEDMTTETTQTTQAETVVANDISQADQPTAETPETPIPEEHLVQTPATETAPSESTVETPVEGSATTPTEEAPSAEEDELTRLTKQLRAKEQEAREHYDARLRLQAEFENFRKRKEKEIDDFRKYAHQSLLMSMFPVVEDFERAIAAAEQSHKLEDFLKGIEMIFGKLMDALQKKGVKEIEAAKGQIFNPEIHEAVMQMETDDVPEGTIAQVFQKGYYLHDRVLQAPKVAVAKKKN
jgi:molecular chaperone GrpE